MPIIFISYKLRKVVASDDNTVELVFKRADKAMYDHKTLFKQRNGNYRTENS